MGWTGYSMVLRFCPYTLTDKSSLGIAVISSTYTFDHGQYVSRPLVFICNLPNYLGIVDVRQSDMTSQEQWNFRFVYSGSRARARSSMSPLSNFVMNWFTVKVHFLFFIQHTIFEIDRLSSEVLASLLYLRLRNSVSNGMRRCRLLLSSYNFTIYLFL